MKALNAIALTLVISGAVNWGLIGAFGFDLVAAIAGTTFGNLNIVNQIVYVLVGLAGLWAFVFYPMVSRSHEKHSSRTMHTA